MPRKRAHPFTINTITFHNGFGLTIQFKKLLNRGEVTLYNPRIFGVKKRGIPLPWPEDHKYDKLWSDYVADNIFGHEGPMLDHLRKSTQWSDPDASIQGILKDAIKRLASY